MGLETFEEHQIKESIDKAFNDILFSNEMELFRKGLDYKSKKTRDIDEKLVNLLFDNLKLFKNGWIMANATQTVKLKKQRDDIDGLINEIKQYNLQMNKIVIRLRDSGKITNEQLNDLRELERALKTIDNYEE